MSRRQKDKHLPVEIAVDHGSRGPAYRARPSEMGETIRAGITFRQYLDAHLIDRMHARSQLSDAQHKAAQHVLELHEAAGFEPSVTPGYAPPGWRRGHDTDEEEDKAITRFRALLKSSSSKDADILHSMCLGIHPGIYLLLRLQGVLDILAEEWGY